jgi:hypothetical protein
MLDTLSWDARRSEIRLVVMAPPFVSFFHNLDLEIKQVCTTSYFMV